MEEDLDAFIPVVKIMVIGVGGGGSNAVNQMLDDKLENIDFWVFNTDRQALATSKSPNRLTLGAEVTKGQGAGGNPEVGKKAAEASIDQIKEIVKGYDMIFIACGEGGGTGTGAAPVVAKCAKEAGALTIAIVTRPFNFEGNRRMKQAVNGLEELKKNVDSLIIISNDKLMFLNGKEPLKKAFNASDRVLSQAVKTITDLILIPGLINLDFADVKTVLANKGYALIGFGVGSGADKAKIAAQEAIDSPLLEASIKGARSAIVNITGGESVTLNEASDAVRYIRDIADEDMNIIFGVQSNPQFDDQIQVSVIATDFESDEQFINPDVSSMMTQRSVRNEPAPSKPKEKEPANIFSDDDAILPSFFRDVKKEEDKKKEEEVKDDDAPLNQGTEVQPDDKNKKPEDGEQTQLDFAALNPQDNPSGNTGSNPVNQ